MSYSLLKHNDRKSSTPSLSGSGMWWEPGTGSGQGVNAKASPSALVSGVHAKAQSRVVSGVLRCALSPKAGNDLTALKRQ